MALRYRGLQKVVSELLQLPYDECHSRLVGKIVRAVFQAITEAMKRGERVHVLGLGTFKVRTTKARRKSVAVYRHTKGQRNKYVGRRVIVVKAKKYVHFRADAGIQRDLLERYRDETQPRKALVLLRAHTGKVL